MNARKMLWEISGATSFEAAHYRLAGVVLNAYVVRCFVLLFATPATAMAQKEHPSIPREAFAAWERIDHRPLPKRWHMHSRAVSFYGNETREDLNSEQVVRIDGDGPRRRIVVMRVKTPNEEGPTLKGISDARVRALGVWGINSDYMFFIRRPSPDLQWGVSHISPDSKTSLASAVIRTFEQPRSWLYSIWKRAPMRVAMTLPYCEIVSSGKVTLNGKVFFQLELVAEKCKPERYKHFVAEGKHTILLDPENNWMVVRENYISGELHYVTENVVDTRSGLIKRQTVTSYDRESGKPDGLQTTTFTYFFDDKEPVPEDLFYLTGYGVPEPEGIDDASSWIWWLLAAGIVLVLYGAWLVRRASVPRSAS